CIERFKGETGVNLFQDWTCSSRFGRLDGHLNASLGVPGLWRQRIQTNKNAPNQSGRFRFSRA
ncbi:hypothetical protein, partial [Pseudomonas sp. efr-133-TYG-103a]|uniref:hypothetical protein n=1 Tax=Pseudomonas sp. efr-133-TYG-103a TaxID=3040308 RepID=UPI0025539324